MTEETRLIEAVSSNRELGVVSEVGAKREEKLDRSVAGFGTLNKLHGLKRFQFTLPLSENS